MNVVDSSGWLEYFAGGPNAGFFGPAIERVDELLVPTVSLYEVFKAVLRQRDQSEALRAVAQMRLGRVIDLTEDLALSAAHLSLEERLPLADSVLLAAARAHGATLWTQDADFDGREGVRYRPRVPSAHP